MASHEDPTVNDEFVEWTRSKYEDKEIGELKVTRGQYHDYLAMDFDFGTEGILKIKMTTYIKKMIEDFEYKSEISGKKATTPAAEHIFEVNDKASKLDKHQAEVFHTYVAKALFASMRARPDILLAVIFLCTRVKNPDEDDWKKLICLMRYLNTTQD